MHSEVQKKRKRNGDNSEQKVVKKRTLFPPSLHKKKKKRKRRKTTLTQSFPQKGTSISPGALFPPDLVWKPLFTPEDLKPQPHFPPEKRVTREKYKTTADSKNRIENREELESQLKLPEFGLHKNNLTITDERRLELFRGYERVVYGDHGPYLELMHWNIHWEKFHESSKYKPHTRFYDELLNPTESVLLYAQVRDVKHRWNPPNGERSVFNNRKDGYADYRPYRYYINPWDENLSFTFRHPKKHQTQLQESINNRQEKSFSLNIRDDASEMEASAQYEARKRQPLFVTDT